MEQSKSQFESTPNDFQLNNALQIWRRHLLEEGKLTLTDVTELESHLLDQMEDLAETGLSEQERFQVATLRIGEAKALNQEFAKVNGSMQGQNKLILGLASLVLLYLFTQVWHLLIGGVSYIESYFFNTHFAEWDIIQANVQLGGMQVLSILTNFVIAIATSFWVFKNGGKALLRFEEALQTKPFLLLGKLLGMIVLFAFLNRLATFLLVEYEGSMVLLGHWATGQAFASLLQVILIFVLLYALLKRQTPSANLTWRKRTKQLLKNAN